MFLRKNQYYLSMAGFYSGYHLFHFRHPDGRWLCIIGEWDRLLWLSKKVSDKL